MFINGEDIQLGKLLALFLLLFVLFTCDFYVNALDIQIIWSSTEVIQTPVIKTPKTCN